MKRALSVGLGLVLAGGVVTPGVTPVRVDAASAAVTGAAMPFDFDGDGHLDYAVGRPRKEMRGKTNAGAVEVWLWPKVSKDLAKLWHQGTRGVKGALESGDRFGKSRTSGDFDADGFADLAIGIPREDIRRKKNAGAVQVLYGSPTGLTASGDQVWHQGTKGVPGTNERGDRFGSTLAVGDFDGDGYADLAIGTPREDSGDHSNAGRVVVLRGSPSGLTSIGAQLWDEKSIGIASEPRSWEFFGQPLFAGNINGDVYDDLQIHFTDTSTSRDREAGLMLWGSPAGLEVIGSKYAIIR